MAVVDGKAVTEGRFAHDAAAVEAQRRMDGKLDHETPLSELFDDQIACADMIVVNKTDLLDAEDADALALRLGSEARAGVQVVKAAMGALPADVLLGRGQAAEADIAKRQELHHHHHGDEDGDEHRDDHGHDDFESFVVTRSEIANAQDFAAHAAGVISRHRILRLKGFAAVAGKPMRLAIQAVGPRIETLFRPSAGRE